jgi:hypothetical protein
MLIPSAGKGATRDLSSKAVIHCSAAYVITASTKENDRLCGLVVKVLGYRFRGPGSIPGVTKFSEK